jgi:hypothetical protein
MALCVRKNRHWTWSWASSSHLWSLQPVFKYYVVTPWLSIFVKYINKRYDVEQKMATGVFLNRDYSVQFFLKRKDPLYVSTVCLFYTVILSSWLRWYNSVTELDILTVCSAIYFWNFNALYTSLPYICINVILFLWLSFKCKKCMKCVSFVKLVYNFWFGWESYGLVWWKLLVWFNCRLCRSFITRSIWS